MNTMFNTRTMPVACATLSAEIGKLSVLNSPEQLEADLQSALLKLNLIQATMADGETQVYICAKEALETAVTLFFETEEIQTGEEFRHINEVLDRVSANCGFGGEVELNPPAVRFSQRGLYRRQIQVKDGLVAARVKAYLDTHQTTLMGTPFHYLRLELLIDELSFDVLGATRDSVQAGHLIFLESLISNYLLSDHWEIVTGKNEDPTGRYLSQGGKYFKQPLEPDFEGFRTFVHSYILKQFGQKLAKTAVKQAGCRGAYGYNVVEDRENGIPSHWWHDILKEDGYESTSRNEDGWLHPIPLEVPDNIDELITQAIQTATIRKEDASSTRKDVEFVLADEIILTLGKRVKSLVAKNDQQMQKVLEWLEGNTVWNASLIQAGYNPEYYGVWPRQIVPSFAEGVNNNRIHAYKKLGVTLKQPQNITLADGLRVKCLDLTRDQNHNLVYMRMIGPRSSVNANWAVARSGRSFHCLGSHITPPAKASALTIKRVLPESGWDDWIILHHQASLDKMVPGEPFYCPGEGYGDEDTKTTLMQNFFMRLTKAIAIPVQPAWSEFLWHAGIQVGQIAPLEENCHGLLFWEISPETKSWAEIIQHGLREGLISV